MKVLGAGDIHGDAFQAEKLAQKAQDEGVDVVVLCGDLVTGEMESNGVIAPFKKRNLKVLAINGNHESKATVDFLAELYEIRSLEGRSVKYHDVGIFGSSAVNVGIHAMSEEEIFDSLKKGHDKINYLKKKLMVTHVHPDKSAMDKMTMFLPGSKSVRRAIDEFKPDILFCTHVHEAHGLEEKIGTTRVINVGPLGKIIDL